MTDKTPLDFSGLSTYSLHDRPSKVSIDHFAKPLLPGASIADLMRSLPGQLMGKDFPELIARLAKSYFLERPIIMGIGAHVIKVGLNPILIDLMKRRIITGLAVNGACIVHDTELAIAGQTSEEVDLVIGTGAFGAARETGEVVNAAIVQGAHEDKGLGEALGDYLLQQNYPYNRLSLLANARQLGVPVTVHVAVGTDIVHIHPSADGAAIGKTSHHDFRVFCRLVSDLEGGAYLNIGSAVLLPEVFLKALTVVRNLGYTIKDFTTANFDFISHYRPLTNVVRRPTAGCGKGFHVTGHHELMVPLLAAALIDLTAKGSQEVVKKGGV